MDITCICPLKATGEPRHATDRITFRDHLGFREMLTARNALLIAKQEDPDVSTAEILAVLTELYLVAGIESWTLVDAKGKPVEPTKVAIREHLLARPDIAYDLADEADNLYSEAVIGPLVRAASTSSPATSTDDSTSVTSGPSPKSPKPSRRSSTTTSRTDGIAMTPMSLAGGSSSSQS